MFLAIFALAMHRADTRIGDLPFLQFLAPGLIMMAIVQNAFANTSSSLMIAKIQGNIVDYLMPPLGPGELLFGITMAGITRGVVVGLAVWLCMLPFVPLLPLHPLLIAYYAVAASLMLSLLGFLGGLWAEKFDQMAAVTNFVITPLSFLSGTFYSVAGPARGAALAGPRQPVLLHDRRHPLRLHRPCGRLDRRRDRCSSPSSTSPCGSGPTG